MKQSPTAVHDGNPLNVGEGTRLAWVLWAGVSFIGLLVLFWVGLVMAQGFHLDPVGEEG